jgi:hypothetical protein
MTTPHDKLFKIAFAEPEALRLLLRLALPEGQSRVLDGATLRLLDPVVPSEPGERRFDLLAELVLDGRSYTLDFLFEHQSQPDRAMGLRILGGMVARWRQAARGQRAGAELQPIIAVVVYHGAEPWKDPVDFRARFGLDERANPFARYLPDFRYLVVDLGSAADHPASGPVLALLAARLFSRWARIKRGDAGTLLDELRAGAHLVRRLVAERDRSAFAAIVEYILHVEESATEEELDATLRRITEDDQELEMPTIAERIEQRGVEKGVARGKTEGLREGVARGKTEGLREGVARGKTEGLREGVRSAGTSAFGPCPPHLRDRLEQADEALLLSALGRLRMVDDWEALLA